MQGASAGRRSMSIKVSNQHLFRPIIRLWDRVRAFRVQCPLRGQRRQEVCRLETKMAANLGGLFRHTVNKLAIDLSSPVVDNQYFKVLIVPKAFIAEVLRDLFAMFDRFSIRIELKADAVSHRDAVFHIEKKLSHGQSSIEQ